MNTIDLNDQVAIITGGAQGIGFAIAKRFIASGAKVCLWDNNADAVKNAAPRRPRKLRTIAID